MWGAVAWRIATGWSHCPRIRRGGGCCGGCRIVTVIGISVEKKNGYNLAFLNNIVLAIFIYFCKEFNLLEFKNNSFIELQMQLELFLVLMFFLSDLLMDVLDLLIGNLSHKKSRFPP